MYLGAWWIDDLLTFTCNTHNPFSGTAQDADFDLTYRIYEDDTVVPILTGTMILFDPVNTDGFYEKKITLSAVNGFEAGKSYCIRIHATVGGIVAVLPPHFQIANFFPAGAIEYTYVVTDTATGLPIEGVEVWIATDALMANIVWKGETDVFGVARDLNNNKPWLDAGTYFFWLKKGDFSFTNPDTEIVS